MGSVSHFGLDPSMVRFADHPYARPVFSFIIETGSYRDVLLIRDLSREMCKLRYDTEYVPLSLVA